MLKEALKQLQNHKADPCISILIPTHRISSEKQHDEIRLKNAIKNVHDQLSQNYDKRTYTPLVERLEQIKEELDYSHLQEGLGIFLSNDLEKVIRLPFPVEEKVIIDQSFEIRDLILSINREINYDMLVLSENNTRFFEGLGRNVVEVRNEHFPAQYSDDYEYEKPSIYSKTTQAYHGSHEKSQLEEAHIKQFLKTVDDRLASHLRDKTPLFVLGDKHIVSNFMNVTHHADKIYSNVEGNFDDYAHHHLADKIQPEINKYIEGQRNQALKDLKEKVGYNLVSSGIHQVWRDAKEGKGATLLVESGYGQPAYVGNDDLEIMLEPEQKDGLHHLKDAVDDIMEEVVDKGGQVRFVEDGKLEEYGRIALILRFSE